MIINSNNTFLDNIKFNEYEDYESHSSNIQYNFSKSIIKINIRHLAKNIKKCLLSQTDNNLIVNFEDCICIPSEADIVKKIENIFYNFTPNDKNKNLLELKLNNNNSIYFFDVINDILDKIYLEFPILNEYKIFDIIINDNIILLNPSNAKRQDFKSFFSSYTLGIAKQKVKKIKLIPQNVIINTDLTKIVYEVESQINKNLDLNGIDIHLMMSYVISEVNSYLYKNLLTLNIDYIRINDEIIEIYFDEVKNFNINKIYLIQNIQDCSYYQNSDDNNFTYNNNNKFIHIIDVEKNNLLQNQILNFITFLIKNTDLGVYICKNSFHNQETLEDSGILIIHNAYIFSKKEFLDFINKIYKNLNISNKNLDINTKEDLYYTASNIIKIKSFKSKYLQFLDEYYSQFILENGAHIDLYQNYVETISKNYTVKTFLNKENKRTLISDLQDISSKKNQILSYKINQEDNTMYIFSNKKDNIGKYLLNTNISTNSINSIIGITKKDIDVMLNYFCDNSILDILKNIHKNSSIRLTNILKTLFQDSYISAILKKETGDTILSINVKKYINILDDNDDIFDIEQINKNEQNLLKSRLKVLTFNKSNIEDYSITLSFTKKYIYGNIENFKTSHNHLSLSAGKSISTFSLIEKELMRISSQFNQLHCKKINYNENANFLNLKALLKKSKIIDMQKNGFFSCITSNYVTSLSEINLYFVWPKLFSKTNIIDLDNFKKQDYLNLFGSEEDKFFITGNAFYEQLFILGQNFDGYININIKVGNSFFNSQRKGMNINYMYENGKKYCSNIVLNDIIYKRSIKTFKKMQNNNSGENNIDNNIILFSKKPLCSASIDMYKEINIFKFQYKMSLNYDKNMFDKKNILFVDNLYLGFKSIPFINLYIENPLNFFIHDKQSYKKMEIGVGIFTNKMIYRDISKIKHFILKNIFYYCTM